MSKLVHVLAFGTPKFYIAPNDKIKRKLVNLSSNCDVKSGLSHNKVLVPTGPVAKEFLTFMQPKQCFKLPRKQRAWFGS